MYSLMYNSSSCSRQPALRSINHYETATALQVPGVIARRYETECEFGISSISYIWNLEKRLHMSVLL